MDKPELNEVLQKYEATCCNELIPEKMYLIEVFDSKMNIINQLLRIQIIVPFPHRHKLQPMHLAIKPFYDINYKSKLYREQYVMKQN